MTGPEGLAEPAGLGRRTLLGAGAASAWATPLVLFAVPANAATCSSGKVVVTATRYTDPQITPGSPDPALVVSLEIKIENNTDVEAVITKATATGVEGSTALTSFEVTEVGGRVTAEPPQTTLIVDDGSSELIGPNSFVFVHVTYTLGDGTGTDGRTVRLTFEGSCVEPASVDVVTFYAVAEPPPG